MPSNGFHQGMSSVENSNIVEVNNKTKSIKNKLIINILFKYAVPKTNPRNVSRLGGYFTVNRTAAIILANLLGIGLLSVAGVAIGLGVSSASLLFFL